MNASENIAQAGLSHCSCCGSSEVSEIIDFGLQPICNRFLRTPDEPEARFPLGISVCGHCGLIFMTHNIPADELRPRFNWITYREAEAHLDDAVDKIMAIAGSKDGGFMLGLSSHDASTLERAGRRSPGLLRVLGLEADLGIKHSGAGIETIQAAITSEWAAGFLKKHRAADLIVARYILEHAHDVKAFLSSVRQLAAPDGCVVFEVPDFSVALSTFDYSNIWEEHAFYFTPATLRGMLEQHGFTVEKILVYPYPLENSLVAVCRPSVIVPSAIPHDAGGVSAAKEYAAKFPWRRSQIQSCLAGLAETGKIAIFGAGHLAAKFINLLDLSPCISFVVDDHPLKCGLCMPGSRLPIKPSAALVEEGIRWCLLSLNPESEDRVLKNLKPLFESGGIKTYSIFRASPTALPLNP